jgi:hypothetical protein
MHLHCAYPNPDKSIALVPEQLIEYNKHLDRKNKNAAPEYAVWVKSQDESMNDPFLVMGQKSDMDMHLHCALNACPQLHVARYVLPQLKKLTAPLIAFFHALELDLSNRSLQKRQSSSFALTWIG